MADRTEPRNAFEISGMILSTDSDLIDRAMDAVGDALFDITQDATIGGHLVTLNELGEVEAHLACTEITDDDALIEQAIADARTVEAFLIAKGSSLPDSWLRLVAARQTRENR